MSELVEHESWSNTSTLVPTDEGTFLVMTEAHEIAIPIDDIPATTLGRLGQMRMPNIFEIGFGAFALTTMGEVIIRGGSDANFKPALHDWLQFLAGLGSAATALSLWGKRADLINSGKEELGQNIIMDPRISEEEIITPY